MCKAGADTLGGEKVPDTTPRVAVVTGAAGELGRAMSLAFLASDYDVIGFDLTAAVERLDPLLSTNPRFAMVPGDVTS